MPLALRRSHAPAVAAEHTSPGDTAAHGCHFRAVGAEEGEAAGSIRGHATFGACIFRGLVDDGDLAPVIELNLNRVGACAVLDVGVGVGLESELVEPFHPGRAVVGPWKLA